jgi:hypothetical protein
LVAEFGGFVAYSGVNRRAANASGISCINKFTLKLPIMKKLLLLSAVLVSSLVSLAGDTPVHHPRPHGFFIYHPHHKSLHGPAFFHHGFAARVMHEPVQISLVLPDFRAADAEMEAQAPADEIILPGYRTIDFTSADADMIAAVQAVR